MRARMYVKPMEMWKFPELFPEVIISQNIIHLPVASLSITEPLRVETSEASEPSQRAPKLVWCPRKCFSWTRSKFTDLFLRGKKKNVQNLSVN